MKQTILALILLAAGAAGGVFWMKTRGDARVAAPATASPQEEPRITITHSAEGNVVIKISRAAQGGLGLRVAQPAAARWNPEVKGYGRVLDPGPLVALVNELGAAQAALTASNQELERSKTLLGQGNTSVRALQTAEAAAAHDQLQARSARDRLALAWGRELAERPDLPAFAQSLASFEAALVRIDLPGGERLAVTPGEARLVTLSGVSAPGVYLASALAVDPQIQAQGFLFLVKPNQPGLLVGEAVTGYVKIPGEPVPGVIIPRAAIVRTEGAGWVCTS